MERKKRNRLMLTGTAVLVGTVLFCSGMKVGAATNEPGSAGDPLITRSYLEAQLENVAGAYECITLNKGQSLPLMQGDQVIVYAGSASLTGSLIDITEGSLTDAGAKTVKYHSYLSPADGSGLTADSTCVIFLSGSKN